MDTSQDQMIATLKENNLNINNNKSLNYNKKNTTTVGSILSRSKSSKELNKIHKVQTMKNELKEWCLK